MKISIAVALFFVLASCGTRTQSVREMHDEDIVMQVQENKDKSYRVRLFPEKRFLAEKSQVLRDNMWYKMDSCFYILKGENKVYPVFQEPIANGIGNSFEYLILFDEAQTPRRGEEIKFIYQDKHINKKSYSLPFNTQL